jgi:hypothetical protein
MFISNKPISSITEGDLIDLITNQVAESKIIDYKLTLPGNSENDKKEFLADIASFANTAGGYLIYGMAEKQGVGVALPGVGSIDPDSEVLRLDQIIREGIDPRLPGIAIQPIKLQNNSFAVIIHIPQSYASPHMVTFKGSSRFYARQSNGKYPLDVHELRQAFLLSATVGERIRDFRLERVARVGADETPLPLYDGKTKLIVHILPFTSFSTNQAVDIVNLGSRFNKFFQNVSDRRYNIDGISLYTESRDGLATKYYQIFRSGAVEFTEGILITGGAEKPALASFSAEDDVLVACESTFSFLKAFGIEPPIFVLVTLTGVKGTILASRRHYGNATFFDRDTILIPEIQVDSYPDSEEERIKLLKPALDAMWNAGGMPGSESFDNQGRWRR